MSFSDEGSCLFPRGVNSEIAKILKSSSLIPLNKTWFKAFLGEGDSSFYK